MDGAPRSGLFTGGKECNFWMEAHSLGGFADISSIDDLLAVTGIALLC